MATESSCLAPNIKTILFDLDGTLLVNPMSEFIPAYLSLFSEFVKPIVSPELFTSALLRGVRAMEKDCDPSSTNEQVFFAEFFSHVDVEESRLRLLLESFYTDEYPKLAKLAKPAKNGRKTVDATFQVGLEVVIATNPLFPEIALEQRLEWANLSVTEFDFALVTTFEGMHAAKPNLEYYREILDSLGRKPEECIMVGDDWERDIAPASSIGLRVFWIEHGNLPRPAPISSKLWLGQGSLEDLKKSLFE